MSARFKLQAIVAKSVFNQVAFDWESRKRILQSNAKFENRFHLREIRPQGRFQLRNPNRISWISFLTVRLGNPKKDLQNCSREQQSYFC